MADTEHIGTVNEDSISSAISRLMEHPEIIGAVASALSGTADATGAAKDGSEAVTEQSPPPENSKEPDLAASLMPIISRLGNLGLGGGKSGGMLGGASGVGGKHAALLCALKPYLSKNRCDAIDYILKISQMSELISKLR